MAVSAVWSPGTEGGVPQATLASCWNTSRGCTTFQSQSASKLTGLYNMSLLVCLLFPYSGLCICHKTGIFYLMAKVTRIASFLNTQNVTKSSVALISQPLWQCPGHSGTLCPIKQ